MLHYAQKLDGNVPFEFWEFKNFGKGNWSDQIKQNLIDRVIRVVFKCFYKYWIQSLICCLIIFVLQKMFNNETTYFNGEYKLYYPLMHNQKNCSKKKM